MEAHQNLGFFVILIENQGNIGATSPISVGMGKQSLVLRMHPNGQRRVSDRLCLLIDSPWPNMFMDNIFHSHCQ